MYLQAVDTSKNSSACGLGRVKVLVVHDKQDKVLVATNRMRGVSMSRIIN